MTPTVPRETFIALRARREAYQIATDILYEAPIDVRVVACGACGKWIDVHGSTVTDPLTCPACRATTPLPPYLRAKYMPRFEGWQLLPKPEAPREVWTTTDFTDAAVPRWLIWFSVALSAVGLGVAAALIAP